ncbi:MAG: MFS transporter [Muribaculaceae bacterium]|nr:MFS transporter [Muribaculaceae bacterium]
MNPQKILNRGFCMVTAANFMLFLSFYAIMPVLPYFLEQVFNATDSVIGIVISTYSVACILIRPFSGWMLDTMRRRPIYLAAYAVFMVAMGCYPLFTLLGIVVLIRFVHGLAFGVASASGTTLVTYLVPRPRLGEGLGLYGLSSTIAMSVGPMIGLAAHQLLSNDYFFFATAVMVLIGLGFASLVPLLSNDYFFFATAVMVLIGLGFASLVPVPEEKEKKRRSISLKSLFLVPATVPAIALVFASVPYGITTSYISLLADEYHLPIDGGLFYTLMAVGLALSRVFGGKMVDRYSIPVVILISFISVTMGYILLTATSSTVGFLSSAIIIGLSFGLVHPAFNTLFVNIGGDDRRGVATSSYLTAFDLGIGLGILFGGIFAQLFSGFHSSFVAGAISLCISITIFASWYHLSWRKR